MDYVFGRINGSTDMMVNVFNADMKSDSDAAPYVREHSMSADPAVIATVGQGMLTLG